ncbi:DUF1932 domain-containing protein [Polymorphobacter sp.]|uniref:DUF1932 domain-containing protein n=1 Tax=Polymorphobacter sp. TaxID=1909290 RepID=UPI003F709EA9
MQTTLALIGYGEAGSTFARVADWGAAASGHDLLPERRASLAADGLRPAANAAEALAGASLVLSLVTADQALAAAQANAGLLAEEAIWCDMNSVAPETKRRAAAVLAAAGHRYVDVAILAPVHPARLAVPLLLSGEAADAAGDRLRDAGFTNVRSVGTDIGQASAIKMIRSVMVKGIEALTAEMMLAAEAAGVADEVLASLDASERPLPWARRADYNIERMVSHGLRRAAEMEESVKTLAALGVDPLMTMATVRRQRAQAGRPLKRRPAA